MWWAWQGSTGGGREQCPCTVFISWGCRHKLLQTGGVKQGTHIFSQPWRTEVQNQGVGRATLHLKTPGDSASASSWEPQVSLGCGCVTPASGPACTHPLSLSVRSNFPSSYKSSDQGPPYSPMTSLCYLCKDLFPNKVTLPSSTGTNCAGAGRGRGDTIHPG